MKKNWLFLVTMTLLIGLFICFPLTAQGGKDSTASTADPNADVYPGVKRGDTLIVEDPSGTLINPDSFNVWNVWAGGNGGVSNGLQQLAMDTLWYLDPDAGIDGAWHNSLAADSPIYNDSYTQMTVKLKKGIYWSDGVEFTSADVAFTVNLLKQNPTLLFGSTFQVFVNSVDTPDKYTVIFNLSKANSRFHRNFTVRWNACWIMPKHVVEKAVKQPSDALAYTFNPPVSLGAYVLKDYDKQGTWTLWEKRKDWNRTSLADFGEPVPPYVMYIDAGPSDKRVITQANHGLDMIHSIAPEGIIKLAENEWQSNWFDGFPWGHPDPTLVAILPNNAKAPFDNKDVRWALALSLDMTKLALASYKGAVTMSPIHYPPTGGSAEWYFDPMQQYLADFTINTGKETIHPYDTTIAQQIADAARKNFGDAVPTDPERIKSVIGQGWWGYNPEAAADLLEKNGFTKVNGKWFKPNGEQFTITLLNWGPGNPVLARLGSMVAEIWTNFGIDTTATYSQDNGTMYNLGEYDVNMGWNIETWGGHPDLSYFVDTWHSDFYKGIGEMVNGRNGVRYKSAKLDAIVDEINVTDFDSERNVELGIEFLKLTTQDMPTIPLMSYNVFSSQDNTFWSNYPTFDNPYANPVTNWGNSRYILTQLKQEMPPTK